MIKLKQNRSLFSAHTHTNHIKNTVFCVCGIQHLGKQFYHTACLSTCTPTSPSHNLGLFCITTLLPDVKSWRQLKHCAWSLTGGSQWSCSDWIFYMQGGNQQICWQCQLNRKARLGKHSPPPTPQRRLSQVLSISSLVKVNSLVLKTLIRAAQSKEGGRSIKLRLSWD